MESYYTAVICKNGHCISSYKEQSNDNYCSQCGAELICNCQKCHESIRGLLICDISYAFSYEVPAYCWKCGFPFPWTESALEATKSLILEDTELSQLEQNKLLESLPDIISETPKTQLAIVRVKKALLSAGKFTAEGLRKFAIDFGCELVKKQLGIL